MSENILWIWLGCHCLFRRGLFDTLIRHFKTVQNIYAATEEDYAAIPSVSEADRRRLCDKDTDRAMRIMNFCVATGVGILTYGDPRYPSVFRDLPTPPLALYYKGTLPNFENQLFITVVGTRRMSEYGKTMAVEIAYDLTTAGAVVVTGLASGVDGAATAAALYAKGKPIVFLGSGIDIIYPAAHQYMAYEIIRRGGIILTEYPPGTRLERQNFPYRNRLLSGIAHGVLVVEGGERSGALITAAHAQEQGRDLFALPGNANEENSEATTYLLKNGATAVDCADDILSFYDKQGVGRCNIYKLLTARKPKPDKVMAAFRVDSLPYTSHSHRDPEPGGIRATQPVREAATGAVRLPEVSERRPRNPSPEPPKAPAGAPPVKEETSDTVIAARMEALDETARAVYGHMPKGSPVSADELCAASGEAPGNVMSALTMLEINKLIVSVAGGRYLRL